MYRNLIMKIIYIFFLKIETVSKFFSLDFSKLLLIKKFLKKKKKKKKIFKKKKKKKKSTINIHSFTKCFPKLYFYLKLKN